MYNWAFSWWGGKEPACQCMMPKTQAPSLGRKIPWRGGNWQPAPVFLPGKSHGQRSLAGYSPWGSKELETIEWLSTHSCTTGPPNWHQWGPNMFILLNQGHRQVGASVPRGQLSPAGMARYSCLLNIISELLRHFWICD